METQLGPGESALCCLLLKNKHHLEIRICGYLFVLSFIAGLLNYFLMTFHFNNLSQVIEMEIHRQAENEVISRFHTCPPSFLRIFTSGGSTVRVIHTYSHLMPDMHTLLNLRMV